VTGSARAAGLLVLKIGGELIETRASRDLLAERVKRLAAQRPTVIVHGGGREIDADLKRRGIPVRIVDGIRVTDPATLESVVTTLAGTVNTGLVVSLVGCGVRAVGLTGADASMVPVTPAPLHATREGALQPLGRVGLPIGSEPPALLIHLLAGGYVPVVACVGIGRGAQLFNVNADTLAAHLALVCRAADLILAAGTPGVLDRSGRTIPTLNPAAIARLIAGGVASAGMVAKLMACLAALNGPVERIRIVDGRTLTRDQALGTEIVADDIGAPATTTQEVPV
jgi:acetylglutamate kinase